MRIYPQLKPDLYIVSVSSGAPSALCALLAIEQYGSENVELVFADTKVENKDNYRFLADLEAYTGKEITRLCEGRTPLQVADDEHYIPNQAFATCTYRLKIEPIMQHVSIRQKDYIVHMLIGYDLSDKSRVAKTKESWLSRWVMPHFPIIEAEILEPKRELKRRGFNIPYTYSLNFKHGNCLHEEEMGGCVKFGKTDMIRVLIHMRAGYLYRENWEINAIQKRITRHFIAYLPFALLGISPFELGFKIYTFLRDANEDYLTLRQFRLDYEKAQADKKQLRLFEFEADLSGCSTECSASDPGKLAA